MCHQLATRGLPNYNINNANRRHFHSVCFVCVREAAKRYRDWRLFSGRSSVVTFLHLVAAARSLTPLSFVSGRSKERERRQDAERSGTQEVFRQLCAQFTLQNFN